MLIDDITKYVALHRNLGFKYRSQDLLLRNFAIFAQSRGDIVVKTVCVLDWASRAPSAAQQRNRLLTVRRFAIAMRLENAAYEIPPEDAFGHASFRRGIAHIYSEREIQRLIDAALQMKPIGSIRSLTYATLFSLLISTGIRISEALSLTIEDVTEDGLTIRHSKFRKSRLVPIHETTRAGLEHYIRACSRVSPLRAELFQSASGASLSHSTVNAVFLRLARSTGLRKRPGQPGARLHDMRHTFAVRSLEQCVGDSRSIRKHLHALSTYLGHAQASYTYWYLQATPLLMAQISKAAEELHSMEVVS